MKGDPAGRPVFDASAALALLQGEKGSDKLRPLQATAVISAVNVAEVLAKLINRGLSVADARAAYEALHLETVPYDRGLACASTQYLAKDVSLGDRCFLATATHYGPGWTSDHDLHSPAGRAAVVRYFRRPDI